MSFIDYKSVRCKMQGLLPAEDDKTIIDRCQRLGFEADRDRTLSVDGVEGPKTRAGRYVDPALLMSHPVTNVAFKELLDGSREIGGSNMGPFVRKYFRLKADPSKNAGPFCAGGASFCLDQAYPPENTPYVVGAIRLGRAVASGGSLKKQLALKDQKLGDLSIWERKTDSPGTGHVALFVTMLPDFKILSLDFNVGGFPAPTRCFISDANGARGGDKFLFGARWK